METANQKKFLREEMFWDTYFEKLDLKLNQNLIIQRVVDFGTWEEFLQMVNYYGDETVIKESVKNRELSNHGAYFISHYFDVNIKDFTCYKKRQSSLAHFHF